MKPPFAFSRSPLRFADCRFASLALFLATVLGRTAAPMPVDQSRSTTARQLAKPVLAARLLDDMESPAPWTVFGVGQMSFTTNRARDGAHSLRLTSPTTTEKPPPVQGRPFGETGVRRNFADEDWSGFNRVSVWVYPDLPGFHVVSLLTKLQSEGTQGRSYTDGGLNFVLVTNRVWNHVVWEIAHLDRRHVSGLDLIYRLQGNEPGATNRVGFDFDQLELQRVEPDYFQGWAVAPGRIAYNHLGYAAGDAKVAFASGLNADEAEVVNATNGERIRSVPVRKVTAALGEFAILDFSDLQTPGSFRLRAGDVTTPPFAIGGDPWRQTIEAELNFFFCERCGCEVPGIHGVCHQDWQVKHGDRRLPINGGWHDAGDLSQGLVNTSEAAWSMLRLAEAVQPRESELADRLRAEARWGVEWLLKTRFGDGYRVTWATMDFWTDGVPGNQDDVVVDAHDSPFENFLAAATAAAAARAFADSDKPFSDRCLNAAEADFGFALAQLREPNVEVASAGVQAGSELFRATQRRDFADKAVELADVLLSSQERHRQTNWSLPLAGFFHRSPRQDAPSHYSHRSHEQAPVVALADLCELLPDHPKWIEWYAAVALYAEYLRATAEVTAPYHLLPAGIWRTDQGAGWERAQARQGIRLDDRHYLRRFPCWPDFRGNEGVLLSEAKALSVAAQLRGDPTLRSLAEEQLHWTLGRNPFGESLMYGVGHDYAPQYTAMSGDMVGSLPVGIQTRGETDVPYWPTANCYNYAEVWVHPASRWLAILADLAEPAVQPTKIGWQLAANAATADEVEVTVESDGTAACRLELRAFNLELPEGKQRLAFTAGTSATARFQAKRIEGGVPWVLVARAPGTADQQREVYGR